MATTTQPRKNGKSHGTETDPVSAVELVTPAIAESWLLLNHCNRTLKQTSLHRYEEDLRNGTWDLTHQSICFDTNGNLIDGQHRLTAIVNAGVSIRLMVTRNAAPSSASHIDVGVPRSRADAYTMFHGIKYAHRKLAAVRLIGRHMGVQSHKMSQDGELAFLLQFDQDFNFLYEMMGDKYRPVLAAFTFARKANPKKVDAFARKFIDGDDLSKHDPALLLRNTLNSEWVNRRYNQFREANFLRALNALYLVFTSRKINGTCIRVSRSAFDYFLKYRQQS